MGVHIHVHIHVHVHYSYSYSCSCSYSCSLFIFMFIFMFMFMFIIHIHVPIHIHCSYSSSSSSTLPSFNLPLMFHNPVLTFCATTASPSWNSSADLLPSFSATFICWSIFFCLMLMLLSCRC